MKIPVTVLIMNAEYRFRPEEKNGSPGPGMRPVERRKNEAFL